MCHVCVAVVSNKLDGGMLQKIIACARQLTERGKTSYKLPRCTVNLTHTSLVARGQHQCNTFGRQVAVLYGNYITEL